MKTLSSVSKKLNHLSVNSKINFKNFCLERSIENGYKNVLEFISDIQPDIELMSYQF
jgi:hypothetical protein